MNMTLKEYQNRALERLNPVISNQDKESMRFCCMGLLEELNILLQDIFEINLEKVNCRYDKNGKANIAREERDDR